MTGGLLMEITATPSLTSMDTGESRAMGGRDFVCASGVGYIRTRLGRVNLRDDEASVSEPTNRRILGPFTFLEYCLPVQDQPNLIHDLGL